MWNRKASALVLGSLTLLIGAAVSCSHERTVGWSTGAERPPAGVRPAPVGEGSAVAARGDSFLPPPPVAERDPVVTTLCGEERVDDYAWLREKASARTIEYLEAENRYADAAMAGTTALQEALYAEMLGRIKEDDLSVPYRKGEYYYYSRTEEKKPYRIHCRKKGSLDAPEEVLMDENAMAEGLGYFRIGVFDVSPDHRLLAYSVDTNGSEHYTLRFKDLMTGATLPDAIENTYYSSAWASDNRTFFYVTLDAADRPYKLWRHTLGEDPSRDALAWHEADERFFVGVGRTRSEAYIMLDLSSMATTEVRALPAGEPGGEFRAVMERKQGVEGSVDHHGDRFFIVTNEDAVNFRLMEAPASAPARENWRDVIPHREDATITGVQCFADHLVVHERERGLPTIHVRRFSTGVEHAISFPEQAYNVFPAENEEFDAGTFRLGYTSLITPMSIFDYDMNTRERTLLKEQPVLGGYDRTKYETKRIWAKAPDGKRVPISLVHRRGLKRDGKNPCLLNGYGSYGSNFDPGFSSNTLSLLDRGFVYAIAHIRGGAEMGRRWYEDGRLMHKKNTFTDFIACAEELIDEEYTSKDRLGIAGASAGGLLMGAVTNMRPDLFKVVLALVPFVDVVNTMTDPTIPLTVTEWEQWGDPRKQPDFDYIRSYSPYDNVATVEHPDMLIRAGLNDPRVGYWEPAKWTAKLRRMNTGGNLIILKTNMGAGHGGASGRYERLRERAYEYAFLIDRLGAPHQAMAGAAGGARRPRRRRRGVGPGAARRRAAGATVAAQRT